MPQESPTDNGTDTTISSSSPSSSYSSSSAWGTLYLVSLTPTNPSFRFPELDAVSHLLGIRYRVEPLASLHDHIPASATPDGPDTQRAFLLLRLQNDDEARALASRCTCVKAIWHYWGSWVPTDEEQRELATNDGASSGLFRRTIRDVRAASSSSASSSSSETATAAADAQPPPPPWRAWSDARHLTTKGTIVTHHRHLPGTDQLAMLSELVAAIPLHGPIQLRSPELEFGYVQEWTGWLQPSGSPSTASSRLRTRTPPPPPPPAAASASADSAADQANHPRPRRRRLLATYLGRKLPGARARELVDSMDVKKRAYIGNTSMESEMSLVMANMALAREGSLVYDPFCGTGSLLYAAAAFGACCLGSDIDGSMMHGKGGADADDLSSSRSRPITVAASAGRSTNGGGGGGGGRGGEGSGRQRTPTTGAGAQRGRTGIARAARQYGVSHLVLDTLTFDFTQHPLRHVRRRGGGGGVPGEGGIFDAIVADPPYGVRAGAKRLAGEGEAQESSSSSSSSSSSRRPPGRPAAAPPPAPAAAAGQAGGGGAERPSPAPRRYNLPTRPYPLGELVADLVGFAARSLVPGGRLVFWLPTMSDDDDGDEEVTEERDGGSRGAKGEGEARTADASCPASTWPPSSKPTKPAGPPREVALPSHPEMRLVAQSLQDFGRWGRRLITMERLHPREVATATTTTGGTAALDEVPEAHRHGGAGGAVDVGSDGATSGGTRWAEAQRERANRFAEEVSYVRESADDIGEKFRCVKRGAE